MATPPTQMSSPTYPTRVDSFFAAYANPKWDLWRGGSVKSNSTRPFLWKQVWGEDWVATY